MADELRLLVNGRNYAGWTDISFTTALDAISGAFNISLTERWAGAKGIPSQAEPWPILNGDACKIVFGNDVLLNGYVDQFRPSFGPTAHSIEVQGRDKTCDLVDCSAYHQPDQWKNLTLLQIAVILCAPFGVPVRADVDVGEAFPVIKLQQGETVFAALDRLARFRKCILSPDKGGGVLITRAGRNRATVALEQGVNILGASGLLDTSQRFSLYVVKGQSASAGITDPALAAHTSASVTDSGVRRYRPLVVMAEKGGTNGSAQERATWEANVRLGRSATAEVTVRGWRQGGDTGPLWAPNLLVPVRASFLRMAGDMLIRQVVMTRTQSEGTLTRLTLVSPQAFAPEPPDKDKVQRQGNGRNIWREALGEDTDAK